MAYFEGEIPVVSTNNGGFGNGFGDSAWWIIVLLLFGYGGYGRGNMGAGAANDYVLVSDFAQIERKLDTITSGICDSTFALNNTIVNGLNNTNATLVAQGYETRNAINAIGTQLASCCCDLGKTLLENRYLEAQNTCAINNAIAAQTRDILEGQRNMKDAIFGYMTSEKISGLEAEKAALAAQISQSNQTAYLINALRPTPTPAYTVPNPYCCYTGATSCC